VGTIPGNTVSTGKIFRKWYYLSFAVYVDVSTLTGPLQLSVLSTMSERKRYKIRICQIAASCTSSNNCLQYYTGVTGMVSSFNYDQAALINRSEPGYFVSCTELSRTVLSSNVIIGRKIEVYSDNCE
jgi:hypothetical protein